MAVKISDSEPDLSSEEDSVDSSEKEANDDALREKDMVAERAGKEETDDPPHLEEAGSVSDTFPAELFLGRIRT